MGLFVSFVAWLGEPSQLTSGPYSLYTKLSWGLSFGLSFGFWNALIQLLRDKSSLEERSHAPQATIWRRLAHLIGSPGVGTGFVTGLLFAMVSGIVFIMVSGLVFGPVVGPAFGLLDGLVAGLLVGLYVGLLIGMSSGLLSSLLRGRGARVQPVDQLIWSWGNLGKRLFSKQHIRPTAVVGLVFGLAAVQITVLTQVLAAGLTFKPAYVVSGLIGGMLYGLVIALGYWLLLGFWQGVSSATIEDQLRVAPNQGIRRSAYNALVLGFVSALIVVLTAFLSALIVVLAALLSRWPTSSLTVKLSAGLLPGLYAGLVVGLLNGGLACLRHYVLRFLLWRAGSKPWNYPRFLDYAAERILLRKVGGGYIFVHRLLLEYFASLDSAPTPAEARAQKQRALPVS